MKRAVAMAAFAAAMLAQANPVCPSCGREAPTDDAKVCGHCQTLFPKPRAAEASEAPGKAAAPSAREPEGEGPAFEAVKDELAKAAKLEAAPAGAGDSARKPNIAFFHYRNALAMAPLAKITNEAMRDSIASGVRKSLEEVTHWGEKCPACKGTREFVQKTPDIGQGAGRIGSRDWLKKKIPCPLCKAKGTLPGYRNYANITRYLAEGRREFDSAHQAAGDRKIGFAWVPEALAGDLKTPDCASVASGYGAPCPKCGWTGLEPCKACKGEGVVKCKALGCKEGFVETTTKSALGGGGVGRNRGRTGQQQAQKESSPCEKCSGTALVVCEECAGARLQPCRKCNGEGLAPICARCTGTGLSNCRKCNGTGRCRRPGLNGGEEECQECRGQGEVNCQGCNGIGRRSGGF